MKYADLMHEATDCLFPFRLVNSPDSQISLCYEHNNYSDAEKKDQGLFHDEVKRVLINLKNMIERIRLMKLKTVKKTETMISFINSKTLEKIRKLNEVEKKCNYIWNKINIQRLYCRRVFENVEKKVKNYAERPGLYFSFRLKFDKLSKGLSISPSEQISITRKFDFDKMFFGDSRLLCSYLPITEKLRVMAKTNIVVSLDLQILDNKILPNVVEHLNLVLNSPKHLVIVPKLNLLLLGHDQHVIIRPLCDPLNMIHISELPSPFVDIILDPSNNFFTIISNNNIEKFDLTQMVISKSYSHGNGQFYISKPFSNNSKVVLGNYDGYLWIFEIKEFIFTHNCKPKNKSSVGPITCIGVFNPASYIVFSDIDYKVKLWTNPGKEQKLVKLFEIKVKVNIFTFSPDAHFLIGICKNCEVKVWNCFNKFKQHFSFTVKIKNIFLVLFSKNFSLAVVCNGKKGVVLNLMEKKIKAEEVSLSFGVSSSLFINTIN